MISKERIFPLLSCLESQNVNFYNRNYEEIYKHVSNSFKTFVACFKEYIFQFENPKSFSGEEKNVFFSKVVCLADNMGITYNLGILFLNSFFNVNEDIFLYKYQDYENYLDSQDENQLIDNVFLQYLIIRLMNEQIQHDFINDDIINIEINNLLEDNYSIILQHQNGNAYYFIITIDMINSVLNNNFEEMVKFVKNEINEFIKENI